MQFVVKMRKDVKPYHSRYEPELRVTYTNSGGEAGVTSTPLQVLGLGGSRIVAVAPHQDNLVWKISICPQERERVACKVLGAVTPTPVRAAGVHQLTEEGSGAAQEPKWVTMLECERLETHRLPGDPGPFHLVLDRQGPEGERCGKV